uniref:Uncharacterized protein n=1 Tax=Crocodylus porosus TaxID=8502 RepID=A0A7M4FNT4_CROPO
MSVSRGCCRRPASAMSRSHLFGCLPFESSWKNSLLRTQRIKKEYTSAFGLRDSEENMAIPNLTQGIQKYQANRSPLCFDLMFVYSRFLLPFLAHHHFTDPVTGAAPEYLQRLSQMASLECETINEEKNRKMKRGKKQETWTS